MVLNPFQISMPYQVFPITLVLIPITTQILPQIVVPFTAQILPIIEGLISTLTRIVSHTLILTLIPIPDLITTIATRSQEMKTETIGVPCQGPTTSATSLLTCGYPGTNTAKRFCLHLLSA